MLFYIFVPKAFVKILSIYYTWLRFPNLIQRFSSYRLVAFTTACSSISPRIYFRAPDSILWGTNLIRKRQYGTVLPCLMATFNCYDAAPTLSILILGVPAPRPGNATAQIRDSLSRFPRICTSYPVERSLSASCDPSSTWDKIVECRPNQK